MGPLERGNKCAARKSGWRQWLLWCCWDDTEFPDFSRTLNKTYEIPWLSRAGSLISEFPDFPGFSLTVGALFKGSCFCRALLAGYIRCMNESFFLHARPWIPGDEIAIFTACYSLVKIAFAPICACKNNRRIWRHNASVQHSRDVTDLLWWRPNTKSEKTVLSDNGEISDR